MLQKKKKRNLSSILQDDGLENPLDRGAWLQHVLSDFRALGVSLHQCRTSSSWGCISGGLLEKQRGHSETQPELQLSDQGALGGLGTALPAGHLGSWGSLGGDAPRGVLWAAPGKGSGFCCLCWHREAGMPCSLESMWAVFPEGVT